VIELRDVLTTIGIMLENDENWNELKKDLDIKLTDEQLQVAEIQVILRKSLFRNKYNEEKTLLANIEDRLAADEHGFEIKTFKDLPQKNLKREMEFWFEDECLIMKWDEEFLIELKNSDV
jgi:hypothetical protein